MSDTPGEQFLEDSLDAGARDFEGYRSPHHSDRKRSSRDHKYKQKNYKMNPEYDSKDAASLDEEKEQELVGFGNYGDHSSSSSSNHSNGFNGDEDFYDDEIGRNRHPASSRSSLSSLPGSIVVHPRAHLEKITPSHFAHSSKADNSLMNGKSRRKERAFEGTYKLAPQVRDRNSPFRHPSSVVAMQMGDEYDEVEESPYSKDRRHSAFARHSHRASGVSIPSTVSSSASGKQMYCSPHSKSFQMESKGQSEYPLVLLHCTVLPPTLPLPPGLPSPSQQILKDVLPDRYWRRWKLLEDRIIGSGLLRDRGLLISHPQDMYDVLEERLLESLELVKPRLEHGHFLGSEEEPQRDTDDGNISDEAEEDTCHDCGARVLRQQNGERKWDIKVYAGNGLMRAGAWAAAWREMEKVDVEVGIWLPIEIKRELEQRIIEEEGIRAEEELRLGEEQKRHREIYGELVPPSPHIMHSIENEPPTPVFEDRFNCSPSPTHYAEADQCVKAPNNPPRHEVDLQTLLLNYIRVLANDRRNVAMAFLSVLVLYLAVIVVKQPQPAIPEVSSAAPQLAPSVSSLAQNVQLSAITERDTPLPSPSIESSPIIETSCRGGLGQHSSESIQALPSLDVAPSHSTRNVAFSATLSKEPSEESSPSAASSSSVRAPEATEKSNAIFEENHEPSKIREQPETSASELPLPSPSSTTATSALGLPTQSEDEEPKVDAATSDREVEDEYDGTIDEDDH